MRGTLLAGKTWTSGSSYLFSCEAVSLKGMGESWEAWTPAELARVATMNQSWLEVGTPGPVTASGFVADRSLWPKRDERAGSNQIDLTDHYTTRLDVPPYPVCYSIERGDDDLRALPTGTLVLSNVTFDVRGIVTLRLQSMRGYPWRWHWEQHPVQTEGIRAGKAFHRLHVFHGMLQGFWEEPRLRSGTRIGHYLLHYADGTQSELPIVPGRHVQNWRAEQSEEKPFAPLPEGMVFWTGLNPSVERVATLRLYLTSYENPHPEKEVVSVDFVSAMTTAAPFLVAMTVEP